MSDSQHDHAPAAFAEAHLAEQPRKYPPLHRRLQDTVWVDGQGRTWQIDEMDIVHVRNLIAWLERRASHIKSQLEWYYIAGPQPSGDMACDAFESEQDALWAQPAMTWLNDQPLMIALRMREAAEPDPRLSRRIAQGLIDLIKKGRG